MSGKSMKKTEATNRDTLRPEYRRGELGKGIRGKYYGRYAGKTNVVVLSPDVAKAFPTSAAVNAALRSVLRHRIKSKAARAPG
jgi:hypothetical protein